MHAEPPLPDLSFCRGPRGHRGRLSSLLTLLLLALPLPGMAGFQLDTVADLARQKATAAYEEPPVVPEWLGRISPEAWQKIRFRSERALWAEDGAPFRIEFFHPGQRYSRPVKIHEVVGDEVRRIPFSPGDFDFGDNDFASRIPQDLGFAGFRVHAPFRTAESWDPAVLFLGASYFRAVGGSQSFGLSARGLAIDTGLASGEEFPTFREFWIVRPSVWDTDLVVYALLDSRRMTGAYRFLLRPGSPTKVEVEARLFRRAGVGQLGVAPLTSMFFHGENTGRVAEDYRPEVHDSDGLLLHTLGGEWLWRPLTNPRSLQISELRVTAPRGFGLLQRDRDFAHYQELAVRREQRPGAWVRPRGDWGPGRVVLVEIPSRADTNDNIVAFWVPEKLPPDEQELRFEYDLLWFGELPNLSPGGRVMATRRDRGTREGVVRFVLDFEGGELADIPPETILRGAVTIVAGDTAAELLDQQVIKNPVTLGWRLLFQVQPKSGGPIELRAYLDHGGRALTETWSYQLLP